jgi:hypothetical protein
VEVRAAEMGVPKPRSEDPEDDSQSGDA